MEPHWAPQIRPRCPPQLLKRFSPSRNLDASCLSLSSSCGRLRQGGRVPGLGRVSEPCHSCSPPPPAAADAPVNPAGPPAVCVITRWGGGIASYAAAALMRLTAPLSAAGRVCDAGPSGAEPTEHTQNRPRPRTTTLQHAPPTTVMLSKKPRRKDEIRLDLLYGTTFGNPFLQQHVHKALHMRFVFLQVERYISSHGRSTYYLL